MALCELIGGIFSAFSGIPILGDILDAIFGFLANFLACD